MSTPVRKFIVMAEKSLLCVCSAAPFVILRGLFWIITMAMLVWSINGVFVTNDFVKVVELWEEDGGQRCLTCGHDCPGFEPHSWRNSCSKCSCDRGSHDVSLDYCVSGRERFGVEGFNESLLRKNKKKFEKLGYAWTPPDLNKDKIEEFMNQFEERKRPKLGTVGERYRMIQLLKQLPKQDMTEGCCRHIETTEEKEGYSEFRTKRNTEAFDIAVVKEVSKDCSTANCGGCNDKMETGKLAIFVPKLGDSPSFHVSCFRCSKCLEFPVDLCCCIHEGKVYCERHYADLIKPRCAGCDELIFCREYSNAMSRDFHKSHLACFRCDSSLSGQKYMTKNERPYCVSCYEIQFAHKCDYCKAIIGAGSKELSHKDSFWHDTCFKCIECRKSLVDKPFAVNSGKLYCPDCHDNKFAAKCNKCGKVFKPGFEKYEYQGRQWHEDCFLCYDCDRPIRSKSFIPRDDKIYCNTCYEKRFAKHCFKCKGVVGKLFVTYMDAPWHRECFNCKRCRKNLAEETFTRHQDDPFCTECYTDLFAKKCCRCLKPISGFETSGSTKFVTFETRHWHNSCFTCYRCGLSLAGKKFAAEGTDILCADCCQ